MERRASKHGARGFEPHTALVRKQQKTRLLAGFFVPEDRHGEQLPRDDYEVLPLKGNPALRGWCLTVRATGIKEEHRQRAPRLPLVTKTDAKAARSAENLRYLPGTAQQR